MIMQVKTRLSKKISQKVSKKLTLNLHHQAIHRKMAQLDGGLLQFISGSPQLWRMQDYMKTSTWAYGLNDWQPRLNLKNYGQPKRIKIYIQEVIR